MPQSATGQRPDLCLFNSDGDTFDHGIATVHYENAIYATYTCNVISGFTDRRIRVSGTRGTLDGALTDQNDGGLVDRDNLQLVDPQAIGTRRQ